MHSRTHQFGAELEVELRQPLQQRRIGTANCLGYTLHAQLNMPPVDGVVNAGQAEHLDARVLGLLLQHQRGQRGFHRAKHDD